eukprot:gb/GECH01007268.1/.p1 GENE.gb/GECH01007268.1/~~gb/GECH01007268.1/.p1  ORF type:complete len:410 (+),score=123.48 gb/GECH01007268.1/:1-1230(+)
MDSSENHLQVKAKSVVRLYYSEEYTWIYTGYVGTIYFSIDHKNNTAYIRILDLQNHELVFEQELYENFSFRRENDFFYSFEGEDCIFGICFAQESSPVKFAQAIHKFCREELSTLSIPQRQEKHEPASEPSSAPPTSQNPERSLTSTKRRKKTLSTTGNSSPPTTPSSAKSFLSKVSSKIFGKKEEAESFEISEVKDFQHNVHISNSTGSDEILKAFTINEEKKPSKKKKKKKKSSKGKNTPPPPPPPKSKNNDLPPPPEGQDLPPPPNKDSGNDLPPPPSNTEGTNLPPPPSGDNGDLPPPPGSSSSSGNQTSGAPPPPPPPQANNDSNGNNDSDTSMPSNLLQEIRSVDHGDILKAPPNMKVTPAVPESEESSQANGHMVSFLHDAIRNMNVGESSSESGESDFEDH